MVEINSIADLAPLNLFSILGQGDSNMKIKVLPKLSNEIVRVPKPPNVRKSMSAPVPTKTAKELENEKFLTVRQAAIYSNTPENTIRSKWIAMRRVPFHKIGKSVRFKRVELDEWMDQQKIEPITID